MIAMTVIGLTLACVIPLVLLYYSSRLISDIIISKPRIAICWKCKYCVKTRWWHARIKQTRCRTPNDPVVVDFITGRTTKLNFSCVDRNRRGTCPDYKKVWWRR